MTPWIKENQMEITPSPTPPKKLNPKTFDGMDAELSKLGKQPRHPNFNVLMRISQIYDSKNVALSQYQ